MNKLGEQMDQLMETFNKAFGIDETDELIEPIEAENLNDQTIKADAGKLRLTLVPRQIIRDVARIREYGTNKYGSAEAWEKVDVVGYRDAAFRHFLAYLDDPAGVDDESGLPHLWHLACNIAFLCELEDNNDDRGT